MKGESQKLSLTGLATLVFSSVVGAGIYNISQNMASQAALGAVVIAWVVTAVGMLFLVLTFKILAERRTDLKGGLYQFARQGFGNYMGFNVAWGYWLCTACGNVAYAVMLNDSAASLIPSLHNHGFPTVVFGSILIWGMYLLVSRGLKTASYINILITVIKISSIALIIAILIIYFRLDLFSYDVWGKMSDLGGVGHQISTTMLVTLWCFVGIEGAMTMSSRARRESDVAKAGIIGFLTAWSLYVLITLLSFGVMTQPELASLRDPSIAYILKTTCGEWAYWFVIIAIFVSLLGSWVSWTLYCAEVPYEAAAVQLFPKRFLKVNRNDMPTFGLLMSCFIMNGLLCLVVTADAVYQAALTLTSLMALPSYLFCSLFLCRRTISTDHNDGLGGDVRAMIIGLISTLFCCYIFYSTGWKLLLATLVLYLPGTFFYINGRKQYFPGSPVFTPGERAIMIFIIAGGLSALLLLLNGYISI